MPKVAQNQKDDSSVQPPDFPDLTPPSSNLASPPRPKMRPYDGPMVDNHGFPLRKDAIRRMMWDEIRTQVFRLPNGVILHAHNEVEAGAYENNGAEIVDTIYKDEE